jgi:hypothetical protein
MDKTSEYLTLAALKGRGWSRKLIETLLGAPDKTAVNSYYRSAAPIKLWLIERVDCAETNADFVAHQAKRVSLSARSLSAAVRQREKLMAKVALLQVEVERIPHNKLLQLAQNEWQGWRLDRNDFRADPKHVDAQTRQRWAVNYVRHHLCSYDEELERVARRIGVRSAVAEIRRKVYAAIATAYPELAEECSRQAVERGVST